VFGVEISDTESDRLVTVDDLVALIDRTRTKETLRPGPEQHLSMRRGGFAGLVNSTDTIHIPSRWMV